MRGCSADNNRRQGLSITSARRVLVVDSEFTNTRGTAPQFGVDLEPNDPVDFIDDVTFLRPRTSNNQGGGIMIYLDKLDPTSYRVSISIVEHDSAAESPRLRTKIPETIAADVRYSQAQ